jgi:DUF1365 family protein
MYTEYALYEGWVWHRRKSPVVHTFRYPLYLSYLNLADVEQEQHGASRSRLVRRWLRGYHRADHFGDSALPVSECVRALVQQELGFVIEGEVCLLTHLRHVGYVMNPVSFFYCWNASGEKVDAIVAEVHNTPWGETHCYTLDIRNQQETSLHTFEKAFHVSPFMGMGQEYHWRFTCPAEQLVVHMESYEDGERIFDATLSLKKRSLKTSSLCFLSLRYALMTYRVIGLIYWQAFHLWRKGCPYHPHPRKQATLKNRNVEE